MEPVVVRRLPWSFTLDLPFYPYPGCFPGAAQVCRYQLNHFIVQGTASLDCDRAAAITGRLLVHDFSLYYSRWTSATGIAPIAHLGMCLLPLQSRQLLHRITEGFLPFSGNVVIPRVSVVLSTSIDMTVGQAFHEVASSHQCLKGVHPGNSSCNWSRKKNKLG